MGYLYILLTVIFTVYGQLILKWRLSQFDNIPEAFISKIWYLLSLYSDVWIVSGFVSAMIASVFWMMALTKFQLSTAYPMMSISFVIVFFLSVIFFNETISANKLIGLGFILFGIVLITR